MSNKRIQKLQEILLNSAYDAFLLEDGISLFYLTGMHFSAGKLLVGKQQIRLILDGRYFEAAQAQKAIPVILSGDRTLESLVQEFGIRTLAFSAEDTSYQRYTQLKSLSVELLGIDNPVKQLRLIKEDSEIALLREAAELGSRGYDLVCSLVREGVTEEELARELTLFWLRHGGKQVAFDPIIAFGPNSSQPHYRAGISRLEKGQPVLIDIGVTLHDYHSDMTRVVFFGEPSSRMREIYGIVQRAQQAALELCRPGTTVGELDHAARQLITEAGYGEQFSHSLGHGIGLEVHELPTLRNKEPFKDMVLQPGMAITIEPGIYLAGFGGVRIEDTVIITADGHENLTQRSKDLIC